MCNTIRTNAKKQKRACSSLGSGGRKQHDEKERDSHTKGTLKGTSLKSRVDDTERKNLNASH